MPFRLRSFYPHGHSLPYAMFGRLVQYHRVPPDDSSSRHSNIMTGDRYGTMSPVSNIPLPTVVVALLVLRPATLV